MNNYVKLEKDMFPELRNGNCVPIIKLKDKIILKDKMTQSNKVDDINLNVIDFKKTKNEENIDFSKIGNISGYYNKHKSIELFQKILIYYFNDNEVERVPEFIFDEIRYGSISIKNETFIEITKHTKRQKLFDAIELLYRSSKQDYLKQIGSSLIKIMDYGAFVRFFDRVANYEFGLVFIKEILLAKNYESTNKFEEDKYKEFEDYLRSKDKNIDNWVETYAVSYVLQNKC